MSNRLPTKVVALSVFAFAMPAFAQWLKQPSPGIPRTADGKPDLTASAPKTPDGKPDLAGIWQANAGGYGLNIASDLKTGEVLPWAQALYKQRTDDFSKDFPGFRCLPAPGFLYSLGIFKILETPGVTAFLAESGEYRQILTDGRALPKDPNPTWMGYSVGHWDGDTLVIESSGFNDQTWLDFGGHPHTEALHVTERYRRQDFGHMEIQMELADPKAYTRPWTISLTAELLPDTELLEYVCNENERDVKHFVITEEDRKKSRTVVKVPVEVLSKYVGTYEMMGPDGKPLMFAVTLEGDQLMLKPPRAGGKFPLTPESETTFSIAGAPVVFTIDSSGVATYFVVHTAEGDQKGERKSNPAPAAH